MVGDLVKAVIFDLGQVTIAIDMQRGYQALQPYCSRAPEEIAKLVRAAGIADPFECGQISPRDFVRRFCDAVGIELDYDRFCELWSTIFLPGSPLPEPLLEGLRRRYRLLALSNTNAIHFEGLLRSHPILRHFDGFVLSYEVGVMKPDPRIYQAAVQLAGCRAEECFFTDDIPEYVEGAREAGMKAAQFQSVAQLEGDLAAQGIEWR
jgi:putative hydrolase of the HAD superfamily